MAANELCGWSLRTAPWVVRSASAIAPMPLGVVSLSKRASGGMPRLWSPSCPRCALGALARFRVLLRCPSAPRRSRSGRRPPAARRPRWPPRPPPTRGTEGGVHEQGLARPRRQAAQVADDLLLRHGRAAVECRRRAGSAWHAATSSLCRCQAARRSAAHRRRPRCRRVAPARPARARWWRACPRRTRRRAGSARPSRPAYRSPRRYAAASGRTARPRRTRPPRFRWRRAPASSPSRPGARRLPCSRASIGRGSSRHGAKNSRWSVRSHRSYRSSTRAELDVLELVDEQQRQVARCRAGRRRPRRTPAWRRR